uniref:Uncharacterized protein n=1 Tax=Timema cristinae TaxID=61476 RepID=A0A7R9D112_TIMCR|nr:unnamed protein product [Timema cristinae]
METQKMSLINVQSHDLLKQLVERLVGVSDNESPLSGEVVVQVGDYLDRYVCLTCTWGTHHERQSRLHARTNSLHLCWCEGDGIPTRENKTIASGNLRRWFIGGTQLFPTTPEMSSSPLAMRALVPVPPLSLVRFGPAYLLSHSPSQTSAPLEVRRVLCGQTWFLANNTSPSQLGFTPLGAKWRISHAGIGQDKRKDWIGDCQQQCTNGRGVDGALELERRRDLWIHQSRAKRLFEPVLRTSGLQVRREEETIRLRDI